MMLRDIVGDEVEQRLRSVRAVLLSGLPGSGKTTIARLLADNYGFEHLSSDEIRMARFPMRHGSGPRTRAPDQEAMTRARNWAYGEMSRRARKILRNGGKAVLDATNADQRRDRLASEVTRALGDPTLAVWLVCRTPKEIRADRLRASDPDGLWLLEEFENRIARGEVTLPKGPEYRGLAVLELPNC
jgi:predicted kinase